MQVFNKSIDIELFRYTVKYYGQFITERNSFESFEDFTRFLCDLSLDSSIYRHICRFACNHVSRYNDEKFLDITQRKIKSGDKVVFPKRKGRNGKSLGVGIIERFGKKKVIIKDSENNEKVYFYEWEVCKI